MKWVGWRGSSQLGVCPEQAGKQGREIKQIPLGQGGGGGSTTEPRFLLAGPAQPARPVTAAQGSGEAEKQG